jgi:chromosomal replication initiator protein DnaA
MLRRIRNDKTPERTDAPSPPAPRPATPQPPKAAAPAPAAGPVRDIEVKSPGGRLGDILVEEKIITKSQLEEGLAKRAAEGGFLGQALIELGHLDQDTLTLVLVKQCKIPHLNLNEYSIAPDVRGLIPVELCRAHNMLPVDKMGKILTVAMVDPLNTAALEAVRAAFPELRIKPILCDWPDFQSAFQKFFPPAKPPAGPSSESPTPVAEPVESEAETSEAAPAAPTAPIAAEQQPRASKPVPQVAHGRPEPSQPVPTLNADEIRTAIRDGMRETMSELERRVAEASDLLRQARQVEVASVKEAQQRDLGVAVPQSQPKTAPNTSIEELGPDRGSGLTFENFLFGPNNAPLVEIARRVVSEPGRDQNPLFVCGAVGLGKTHLITAIGNAINSAQKKLRVGLTSAGRFVDDASSARELHAPEALRRAYEEWDVIILDDIQFLGGRVEAQEDLFHIFNAMQERGKQIVIAGDRTPDKLGLLEKRLVSRFDSGVLVHVQAPDWETRVRILRHYANQLNVKVPDDAVAMIAMRHPDDVRRLIGALRKVAARAKTNGGTVTAELASQVLAEPAAEVAA